MSDSLFNLLTREIGRLLEPISYALENPKAMERLLASIGVRQANDEQAALINALRAVADLKTQVDQFMARPSPSLCDIAALLEVSDNAFTALRALKANGGSADAFKDLGRLSLWELSLSLASARKGHRRAFNLDRAWRRAPTEAAGCSGRTIAARVVLP
jgi:hypothetical protein